jgi:adenosine deaminase
VSLGVSDLGSVPVLELLEAGARVALGADDPLLFGSRLAGQYAAVRAAHDLSDGDLATLATMSLEASAAPEELVVRGRRAVAAWLSTAAADDGAAMSGPGPAPAVTLGA